MINSSTVLKRYKEFILRPIEIIKEYRGINLRMDIVAGLTVAVVAIPQSMAYASIADFPHLTDFIQPAWRLLWDHYGDRHVFLHFPPARLKRVNI